MVDPDGGRAIGGDLEALDPWGIESNYNNSLGGLLSHIATQVLTPLGGHGWYRSGPSSGGNYSSGTDSYWNRFGEFLNDLFHNSTSGTKYSGDDVRGMYGGWIANQDDLPSFWTFTLKPVTGIAYRDGGSEYGSYGTNEDGTGARQTSWQGPTVVAYGTSKTGYSVIMFIDPDNALNNGHAAIGLRNTVSGHLYFFSRNGTNENWQLKGKSVSPSNGIFIRNWKELESMNRNGKLYYVYHEALEIPNITKEAWLNAIAKAGQLVDDDYCLGFSDCSSFTNIILTTAGVGHTYEFVPNHLFTQLYNNHPEATYYYLTR
ncbi:MAG: hypothetical protein SFY70_03155 [Bacteroidia bacterium]|nr:hypothetical protein [Bacteroidia bacterium]